MFCNCFSTLLDQSADSSYTSFVGLKTIISSLFYICSKRTEKKIELYLNIPGAVLRPVLAIYDVINELKADGVEIATVNAAL
jgi:ATP-dependent protease ClpP protease subunit